MTMKATKEETSELEREIREQEDERRRRVRRAVNPVREYDR